MKSPHLCRRQEEISKMFAAADLNKDGVVDETEMIKLLDTRLCAIYYVRTHIRTVFIADVFEQPCNTTRHPYRTGLFSVLPPRSLFSSL